MPGGVLKVLVVDDDKSTRLLLRAFLLRQGYAVVEAVNGEDGIQVFERERPDIVIMDVTMPVMDGHEAARAIKAMSGSHFVPVIFLTGMDDDASLVKCYESGGDDFVVKPFNGTMLMTRLQSMQRILRLHNALYEYQRATEEELLLARHVFATVTRRMKQFIPGLGYWTRSAGHLPGDMVLYDTAPSGRVYAMVADFTGHGLSAAIGVIPVADIFFALTRKDFALADIAVEVNRKLRQIFPVGHFCAAAFVASDPAAGGVQVLNAGLPDALLVSRERAIVRTFPSTNLPLGIADLATATLDVQDAREALGCMLVVHTDGLTEVQGGSQQAFGVEGLHAAIRAAAAQPLFDTLQRSVLQHAEGAVPHDDISLLVLPVGYSQEMDLWESAAPPSV